MQVLRAAVKRPMKISQSILQSAPLEMQELEALQKIAQTWMTPAPEITIPRLPTAPVLDGNLDENAWAGAIKFHGSYALSTEKPLDDGSLWQLGWHGKSIYGSVFFPDRDMKFYQGRAGDASDKTKRIYNGDCLEVFFRPAEKIPYYVEFLMNPETKEAWALDHVMPESGYWVTIHFNLRTRNFQSAGAKQKNGYALEFRLDPGAFDWERTTPELRVGETFCMTMIRIDCNRQERPAKSAKSFYPLFFSGHNLGGHALIRLGVAHSTSDKNHPTYNRMK